MVGKRTTISDIAKKLNVSMNTVNKALYGKKGVGEVMRKKIQDTAAQMNYQVNRVAQSMARNPLRIGILRTREWPMVGDDFKRGIDCGLERLRDYNVNGKYYDISSRDNSNELNAMLNCAISDQVSALICNHVQLDRQQIDLLASNNIPFAFLGTDMPIPQRLTGVYSDGKMAGRMAAELLGLMLPGGGKIAIATASRTYRDCEDKVQGFVDAAGKYKLEITGIYEHFDVPEIAAELTDTALEKCPDLSGIYATTANSPAMCRRIVELGYQDKLKVIVTDLYGEIPDYLRSGVVKAALFQDCVREGEKVIELVYAYLAENRKPPVPLLIPPLVVLQNNLEIF